MSGKIITRVRARKAQIPETRARLEKEELAERLAAYEDSGADKVLTFIGFLLICGLASLVVWAIG